MEDFPTWLAVAYYQTPKNLNPRTDLNNYLCTQCGTVNFQNVKYCLKCGQEHGPSEKIVNTLFSDSSSELVREVGQLQRFYGQTRRCTIRLHGNNR